MLAASAERGRYRALLLARRVNRRGYGVGVGFALRLRRAELGGGSALMGGPLGVAFTFGGLGGWM